MTAVDVFVGNYTLIDFELYDLWLNGYTGKLVVFRESRIFAVESVSVYCRNPKGTMQMYVLSWYVFAPLFD